MNPFATLPRADYGLILADPPWAFRTFSGKDRTPTQKKFREAEDHYPTMSIGEMGALPVADIAVMHPPCTVLCNSGVRWLYIGGNKANGPDPARWAELEAAAAFYRALRDATHIPRRAVENPVMHEYAIEKTGRGETRFVQPWWFGDPFFKATGLELVNLPPLVPTNRLTPPKPGTAEHKAWSKVHRAPPGPDRARLRSETFPGIAAAMADQWGCLLPMNDERTSA